MFFVIGGHSHCSRAGWIHMPQRLALVRSARSRRSLVFGFVALLWLLITQTIADADLWGHLRFGLDLLRFASSVTSWDPYSFTSDRAWVNHEWLAELTMAVAYRVAAASGSTCLKLRRDCAHRRDRARRARREGRAGD